MNRLMLTVATAALIPAFALAESHTGGEMADDQAVTEPMDQADAADPMAEDAESTDVAEEGADPMAEDAETTDMAEDSADPMEGDAAATDMASMDKAADLGLNGSVAVSDITGGVVYTLSSTEASDWDLDMTYDAVGEGWERIGSIDDIVLDNSGKIQGIVTEVGGFLGIGDKEVMLPLSDLKLIAMDGNEYAIVTPYTSEQLTDMQSFDEAMQ